MKLGFIAVLLGAFGGVAAPFFGGPFAMARGAILGGCIVAACCVADRLVPTRLMVLMSGVFGGLFGLFAGGVIMLFKLNQIGGTDLAQLGVSVLWVCAAYGAATNLAFRWAYGKGYGILVATAMVFGALFVVHVMRMWEVFRFVHLSGVLAGAFFNCIPFAFAVTLPMCWHVNFDMIDKGKGIPFTTIAVFLLVAFVGMFFSAGFTLDYPAANFKAANWNPGILAGASGRVCFHTDECYVFGEGVAKLPRKDESGRLFDVGGDVLASQVGSTIYLNSLGRGTLLSRHDFKSVEGFALSRDGSALAVLADGCELVVVFPMTNRASVRFKGTWRGEDGLCWSQDGKSVIVCAAGGWLMELSVTDGFSRRLAMGRKPRLAAGTGMLVFLQDGEFFALDSGGKAARPLGVSAKIMGDGFWAGKDGYTVSPCGKFLVFKRHGLHSLLELNAYVVLVEAKPNGRTHFLACFSDSPRCDLKWTK